MAGTTDLMAVPAQPKNAELNSSYTVLRHGISSVNNLAGLHSVLVKTRGQSGPSHQEQDLLRAMLVMAGATLDATTKRAIMDAVPKLIEKDHPCKVKLATEVHKKLLDPSSSSSKGGGKIIAEALLSATPSKRIVDFLIEEMTGGSLQSMEEINRVKGLLALSRLQLPETKLRGAFEARNQIIHELDCRLDALDEVGRGERHRNPRSKGKMWEWAKSLLETSQAIIQALDTEITSAQK